MRTDVISGGAGERLRSPLRPPRSPRESASCPPDLLPRRKHAAHQRREEGREAACVFTLVYTQNGFTRRGETARALFRSAGRKKEKKKASCIRIVQILLLRTLNLFLNGWCSFGFFHDSHKCTDSLQSLFFPFFIFFICFLKTALFIYLFIFLFLQKMMIIQFFG